MWSQVQVPLERHRSAPAPPLAPLGLLLPAPQLLPLPSCLLLRLALLLCSRRQLLQLPLHQRPVVRVAEPQALRKEARELDGGSGPAHPLTPGSGSVCPGIFWGGRGDISLPVTSSQGNGSESHGQNLEWGGGTKPGIGTPGHSAPPISTLSSSLSFSKNVSLSQTVLPPKAPEAQRWDTPLQEAFQAPCTIPASNNSLESRRQTRNLPPPTLPCPPPRPPVSKAGIPTDPTREVGVGHPENSEVSRVRSV